MVLKCAPARSIKLRVVLKSDLACESVNMLQKANNCFGMVCHTLLAPCRGKAAYMTLCI